MARFKKRWMVIRKCEPIAFADIPWLDFSADTYSHKVDGKYTHMNDFIEDVIESETCPMYVMESGKTVPESDIIQRIRRYRNGSWVVYRQSYDKRINICTVKEAWNFGDTFLYELDNGHRVTEEQCLENPKWYEIYDRFYSN